MNREDVPPIPKGTRFTVKRDHRGEIVVHDHGLRRWRTINGELVTFVQYLPKSKRESSFAPWSDLWEAAR